MANKRFKDVISEGFYLFRKSYKTLIIPLALIFITSLIIKNLLMIDLNWGLNLISPAIEVIIQKDPSTIDNSDLSLMFEYFSLIISSEFLNNLTSSIFNVFALCLVSNYMFKKLAGNPSNFVTEIKKALNGRLLLVVLLLGLGIAVGSFLLFIPSIIIFGYYLFYVFTYHSEEGIQPLKEARDVARGAFWKLIGIFILSNLIVFICDIIFQLFADPFLYQMYDASWYNPSTRNFGSIILYDLLYNLPEILLTPLFICFLTSLYGFLKTNREQQLQYLSPSYQPSQSFEAPNRKNSKNLDSGMYCPFCGKFIQIRIEFCPHCGEKLNFDI
ncbi:MAG: zinc ribbon domain-containing protein [Promethearchaeota archaeon]